MKAGLTTGGLTTGGMALYWGAYPLLGITCGYAGLGAYTGCTTFERGCWNCPANCGLATGMYCGGIQVCCCGVHQATYWDRESKLSESSRRCLAVFLLL